MNQAVSKPTKNNWLLDAGLAMSAALASLSGLYFLIFPSGGFRGGRNPAYGASFLFSRSEWDFIHTWSGVVMILIALAHLVIHWNWVSRMARRVYRELTGQCACMNARGHFNVFIDAVVAISFVLSALSGIYFLFVGSSHGGHAPDPMILFPRATWDALHTGASVALIIAAIVHFAIHWRWVVNVTRRVLAFRPLPTTEQAQA